MCFTAPAAGQMASAAVKAGTPAAVGSLLRRLPTDDDSSATAGAEAALQLLQTLLAHKPDAEAMCQGCLPGLIHSLSRQDLSERGRVAAGTGIAALLLTYGAHPCMAADGAEDSLVRSIAAALQAASPPSVTTTALSVLPLMAPEILQRAELSPALEGLLRSRDMRQRAAAAYTLAKVCRGEPSAAAMLARGALLSVLVQMMETADTTIDMYGPLTRFALSVPGSDLPAVVTLRPNPSSCSFYYLHTLYIDYVYAHVHCTCVFLNVYLHMHFKFLHKYVLEDTDAFWVILPDQLAVWGLSAVTSA